MWLQKTEQVVLLAMSTLFERCQCLEFSRIFQAEKLKHIAEETQIFCNTSAVFAGSSAFQAAKNR
jgi:hypothetical protein